MGCAHPPTRANSSAAGIPCATPGDAGADVGVPPLTRGLLRGRVLLPGLLGCSSAWGQHAVLAFGCAAGG